MKRDRRVVSGILLLLIAVLSCDAASKSKEEAESNKNAMKTALAFYEAVSDVTPEMERVMELKDYRVFGYPALVYGGLGLEVGLQKLRGQVFQVEIPFWCKGTTTSGSEVKLRRKLLVRVSGDPSSSESWTVSQFKFEDLGELSLWRQFFTWLLWMFIAPITFFIVLLVFALGFLWAKTALLVAYLMGLPLRIYVSYLWFGTIWGAAIAIISWYIFEAIVYGIQQEQ